MEGSASGQPGAIRHSQHNLRQDFDLHLVEMRNTHLSTGIDEMCAKVSRNLVQIMTSSDICRQAVHMEGSGQPGAIHHNQHNFRRDFDIHLV